MKLCLFFFLILMEQRKLEFKDFLREHLPELITCRLSLCVPDTPKITSNGEVVDGNIFDEMTPNQKSQWKVLNEAYYVPHLEKIIKYAEKNLPELTENKLIITYKFVDHCRSICDKLLSHQIPSNIYKITDYKLSHMHDNVTFCEFLMTNTKTITFGSEYYNAVVHIMENSVDFYTNAKLLSEAFRYNSQMVPYICKRYEKHYGENFLDTLLFDNVPLPLQALKLGLTFESSFGGSPIYKKYFTLDNCKIYVNNRSNSTYIQCGLYYMIKNFEDNDDLQQYVINTLFKMTIIYNNNITDTLVRYIKNPNMTSTISNARYENVFQLCILHNLEESFNILLKKGVDYTMTFRQNSFHQKVNLLQYAIIRDSSSKKYARLLMDVWPDLEEVSDNGWRVIHYATMYGNKNFIEYVLNKNVFVGSYVTKVPGNTNESKMYPVDLLALNENLRTSEKDDLQVKFVTIMSDLFI